MPEEAAEDPQRLTLLTVGFLTALGGAGLPAVFQLLALDFRAGRIRQFLMEAGSESGYLLPLGALCIVLSIWEAMRRDAADE